MAMAVAAAVTLSYRRSRTSSRDWSIANSVPVAVDKLSTPITINIGGKKYETYENTLNQFPNTLLGNPEKRKRYFDEKKNEYFFDRHRGAFTAILYYYQSGGLIERPLHVPMNIFVEELNFFQLTDEIQKQNEEAALAEEEENGEDEEEEGEAEELPKNKTLRKIWLLFEFPSSSFSAKCLAIFSLAIILLSIIIFCIETLPVLEDSFHVFFILNAVCSSWFTFEYVIRLIASPNKIKFLKGVLNILDLLSILPFYVTLSVAKESAGSIGILRVMRVIRVCRIFKLTRHSKGLHILGNTLYASINELIMLMLFLVIGVVLFASGAYYAEEATNPKFESIPAAFWWAVVTMTTVGYGDVSPITTVGKLSKLLREWRNVPGNSSTKAYFRQEPLKAHSWAPAPSKIGSPAFVSMEDKEAFPQPSFPAPITHLIREGGECIGQSFLRDINMTVETKTKSFHDLRCVHLTELD